LHARHFPQLSLKNPVQIALDSLFDRGWLLPQGDHERRREMRFDTAIHRGRFRRLGLFRPHQVGQRRADALLTLLDSRQRVPGLGHGIKLLRLAHRGDG
jgi:hypothetical protein